MLWAHLVGFKGATFTPREPHWEVAEIHFAQHMLGLTHSPVTACTRSFHTAWSALCQRPSLLQFSPENFRPEKLHCSKENSSSVCNSAPLVPGMCSISLPKHHPDRWQSVRTEIRVFFQGALGQHVQLSWHTPENPQVLQAASFTSQQVSKVSYLPVPSFKGNAKDEFGCLLFVVC